MSRTVQTDAVGARRYDIDTMTEHDLIEVVEIEESCGLSRWGWNAYHAELSERDAAVMLVARLVAAGGGAGGQVIGFIAARLMADAVHINNVAVRHAHRCSGAGSSLLATALDVAARRGAVSAFLEVRASNNLAQRLYERHGFRITGRRRNYYAQPAEDALLMSLTLRKTST